MSDPLTLGLGLAGSGAALLQSWLAKKALDEANTYDFPGNMFGQPTDPGGILDKLRANSGVEDIKMNYHDGGGKLGTNTFFATIKDNATDAERRGTGVGPDDKDVILFHPTAGREVMAHELGHAQMSRGMGGRASQFNQNRLVGLSQKANALPLGSVVASAIADDPLQAAAMGVGASLLMDSPQLVNEFQANRRALKLLDESGLRRKGSLGRIAGLYATYPLNSIAKGLVGAGLGYGGKQFFGGGEAV